MLISAQVLTKHLITFKENTWSPEPGAAGSGALRVGTCQEQCSLPPPSGRVLQAWSPHSGAGGAVFCSPWWGAHTECPVCDRRQLRPRPRGSRVEPETQPCPPRAPGKAGALGEQQCSCPQAGQSEGPVGPPPGHRGLEPRAASAGELWSVGTWEQASARTVGCRPRHPDLRALTPAH